MLANRDGNGSQREHRLILVLGEFSRQNGRNGRAKLGGDGVRTAQGMAWAGCVEI
jgi:hypothetical protein